MEKLAKSIIKFRWIIVITVLLLTLFFGYQMKNLTINSDIFSSLPDSDPAASLYKQIGEEFGGNNMGLIVLETENIYTKDVLENIQQITDTLRFIQGVSTVTSITNIIDIKSTEEGIEVGKLVDEYNLPQTQDELDSLKKYILSKDLYKGSIVSEDGTSTVIVFTLFQDVDNKSVANEIRTKVLALNLPETIHFGGMPMMLDDISNLILSDIVWLVPIVFIIIALVLFLSFRSLKGVVLPLLNTGIAIIWTLGILVMTGYELTIISNIIPVVLLAVGSAYTIHVLNSINLNKIADKKQALISALVYIIIPVILASVTTAIGFLSFVFGSYLTMIKDFGVFTAIGTVIALLLSIFFVPALISAFSMYSKTAATDKPEKPGILSHVILKPLVNLLFKHPKYIFTTWIIFIALSIGGTFLIKISVNIADYFKKDNETRISEDILQKKFGGSAPIFVLFEGDMQSPEVLNTMIKTEKFMKEDPYISFTQSVADLVEQMNDAMGEGKQIPDERAKIEQLWFLLDGQDIMPQIVSDNLDRGIIQSRFGSSKSEDINKYLDRMNAFIAENSTEECKITLTGMTSVYMKINDSLVSSLYSSLTIAVILVILIVGVILKSLSKGIYAAIPIIATIFLLFGCMGVFGIPLDIATVLVGSIVLGIGVDYSIHVISGFNYYLKENNNDLALAIEKTIFSSGKAVIINVLSVAAGFLVLIFSQLVPLQHFGILIAICMIGSGTGALTLLPVILILVNRKRKIIAK
ncbi:MAG: MMPL family transporter [Bacteroidales bacterium]|jgi:predicted RND superfamily exporter protein|nr:MMPL family transporter [Bacteroidales bacterium]